MGNFGNHQSSASMQSSSSSYGGDSTVRSNHSVDTNKPCERHFLTNCVLCSGKFYGGHNSSSLSGEISLSPMKSQLQNSPPKEQNADSPMHRHNPFLNQSAPLQSQQLAPVNVASNAMCARHNLNNCFLCSLQSGKSSILQSLSNPVNSQLSVNTTMSNSYASSSVYNAMKSSPISNMNYFGGGGVGGVGGGGRDGAGSDYGRYGAASESVPPQKVAATTRQTISGISLGSIPYSASTSFQPTSSAGIYLGSPSGIESGAGSRLLQVADGYRYGDGDLSSPSNNAPLSSTGYGAPVVLPSTANPIPMDKYPFGNGPTLALGFSTSRSLASPGGSSTYSAERDSANRKKKRAIRSPMDMDVGSDDGSRDSDDARMQEGFPRMQEGFDEDDARDGRGNEDDDEGDDDEDDDGRGGRQERSGSVTWSEDVLANQQNIVNAKNELSKNAARVAMTERR